VRMCESNNRASNPARSQPNALVVELGRNSPGSTI
jgi:hypothetical protein